MPVCLETLMSLCSYVLMFLCPYVLMSLWFRVSGDALTELGNHILYYLLLCGKTTLIFCSRIAPIARILSLMQRALAPRR